jgi:hypothetical protein
LNLVLISEGVFFAAPSALEIHVTNFVNKFKILDPVQRKIVAK